MAVLIKRAELNQTRKRVSGILSHGQRGLVITTPENELWVLDTNDYDPELIGRTVIAEGVIAGYDRLTLDWIGEANH